MTPGEGRSENDMEWASGMNRREFMRLLWVIFLAASSEIADRAYRALPEKLRPAAHWVLRWFLGPKMPEKPVVERGSSGGHPPAEDKTAGARIGDLLEGRGPTGIV